MPEEVTERMSLILAELASGDLSEWRGAVDISRGAFRATGRQGAIRNELGTMAWRGLVEISPVDPNKFGITVAGMEAIGHK